jgi:phosphatidate phosphatase APP1
MAAIRRWLAAVRGRLWRRRTVELHPFRGYGTPRRLLLRGRVLLESGLVRSRLGDSVLDNLRNMLRRFESDEVPGALVVARAGGAELRVRGDAEGFFDIALDLPVPLDSGRVWEPVELELEEPRRGGRPPHATGQVLVPREAQFGVISDLDDTVVHSNATNLWEMAKLTLLNNAHTRLPFEGVAGFYHALQRGRDGQAHNPVFYVSNGPWNLYDLLEDFLDVHGIPPGPILLRDWSLRTLGAGEAHKLAAIGRLFATYPRLGFVLIGDSGERDPEIYRRVALEHPGRVLAVYLRDVAPRRHAAARATAAELAAHGVEVVLSPDTEAARRHALDRGLIVPAALPGGGAPPTAG